MQTLNFVWIQAYLSAYYTISPLFKYVPVSPVVPTSTWNPTTAAGSTAKAAASPQPLSACQRPRLWALMVMASTGPRRGGRPLLRATLQPRASRPQQAQPAPISSKSLLCDSLADGSNSAQPEERKEGEEEAKQLLYGTTHHVPSHRSAGRALFSRGVTSWCFREDAWWWRHQWGGGL